MPVVDDRFPESEMRLTKSIARFKTTDLSWPIITFDSSSCCNNLEPSEVCCVKLSLRGIMAGRTLPEMLDWGPAWTVVEASVDSPSDAPVATVL